MFSLLGKFLSFFNFLNCTIRGIRVDNKFVNVLALVLFSFFFKFVNANTMARLLLTMKIC
jgi:hypothetical protein